MIITGTTLGCSGAITLGMTVGTPLGIMVMAMVIHSMAIMAGVILMVIGGVPMAIGAATTAGAGVVTMVGGTLIGAILTTEEVTM